ncbi:MAG: hypothetical protein MUO89_07370 [Dehalococcoidia bacterium]|nr:hypothetical protein [Dehalococcoidia bacterium]
MNIIIGTAYLIGCAAILYFLNRNQMVKVDTPLFWIIAVVMGIVGTWIIV